MEWKTTPNVEAPGSQSKNIRRRTIQQVGKGGSDEDQISDAETGLSENHKDIDCQSSERAADCETQISEGRNVLESGEGIDLPARVDQEHHAVVGEGCDGEEHEEAEKPTGALESVGKAENSGADDGDEDISESIGLGRERSGGGVVADERGFFSGRRWDFESVRGRGWIVSKPHVRL